MKTHSQPQLCLLLVGLCTSQLGWTADSCEQQVLQQLGWQFKVSAASADVNAHTVCQAASLQAAQNAGELVFNPVSSTPDGLQAALRGSASRCAFQFKVGAAGQRASRKLSHNSDYRFTALQTGWVSFGGQGSAAQGWQQTRSFGRRFQPLHGNTQAFDAFYHGKVRTECGTGRQITQLTLLRELFGDAAFDQVFSAEELSVGTFVSLHDSDSVLLGRHAGEMVADGSGSLTAALGRQAWLGAPGMLVHVKPPRFLDDINNQAENFVVVAVTEDAQQQLAQQQGFATINQTNTRIWQLSQQLSMVGNRYYERLLIERDERLWQDLPAAQKPIATAMLALLQQPFYQGFDVHVHPMGRKPVAFHIARLLDRNPRTPFKIELTLHNLPTEIYNRWVQSQLAACRAASKRPERKS